METKINYFAKIEGKPAEMIIDYIADVRKNKNITIGKSRATQMLLCELYNLKKGVDITKCD